MADSTYLHGGTGSLLAPNFCFCHLRVFYTFYQVVFLSILEKYSEFFFNKMYILIFDQTIFVFCCSASIHPKKKPSTTAAFHVQFQNGKSADLSNVFIMKLIKKMYKNKHILAVVHRNVHKKQSQFFFLKHHQSI